MSRRRAAPAVKRCCAASLPRKGRPSACKEDGRVWGQWMAPPHWLGVPPPPQVLPPTHTPQSIRLPQPSAIGPQSTCEVHWYGTQPLHGPQSSVPEQPSLMRPHCTPQVVLVQVPLPH